MFNSKTCLSDLPKIMAQCKKQSMDTCHSVCPLPWVLLPHIPKGLSAQTTTTSCHVPGMGLARPWGTHNCPTVTAAGSHPLQQPCTSCLLLTPKTFWVMPGATASTGEETTFVLSSTLITFLSQMLLSSIPVLFTHRLCSHHAVLTFFVDVAAAAGVVNVLSLGF